MEEDESRGREGEGWAKENIFELSEEEEKEEEEGERAPPMLPSGPLFLPAAAFLDTEPPTPLRSSFLLRGG